MNQPYHCHLPMYRVGFRSNPNEEAPHLFWQCGACAAWMHMHPPDTTARERANTRVHLMPADKEIPIDEM